MFEWFINNLLKINADKCDLLISSSEAMSEYDIKNSECEKLLGVKFDNKLTFEEHITDVCRKTSRKIYAPPRIDRTWTYVNDTWSSMLFSIRRLTIVH